MEWDFREKTNSAVAKPPTPRSVVGRFSETSEVFSEVLSEVFSSVVDFVSGSLANAVDFAVSTST